MLKHINKKGFSDLYKTCVKRSNLPPQDNRECRHNIEIGAHLFIYQLLGASSKLSKAYRISRPGETVEHLYAGFGCS